ncbi:MAG: ThuA domain-containing protein [Tepidisphaerales bacterium]
MRKFLIASLVAAFLSPVLAQAQQKPIRALLVIGGCCHDYKNQKDVIAKGLAARANIEVTIAYDTDTGTKHKNPVYDSADWAKNFDVVIHDECTADVTDKDVVETILKPHRDGLPGVVIHCGMHSYRSEGFPKATPWFEFTGVASTGHGAQQPIEVNFVDKESPIVKGMENWTTINEELYNNSAGKLQDTAKPLALGKQGKSEFVVIWTNLYAGKAKVFSTTLGHNTKTVEDPRYLDLITRGVLWSTGHLADDGKPAAGYEARK